MRFAYADPPYLGMCSRYDHNHPDGRCWDDLETHRLLIERLGEYDGWALSLHAPSLRDILPLCPERVRVLAWCKTFAPILRGVMPSYGWEPTLVMLPKRTRLRTNTAGQTLMDWLACSPSPLARGFEGRKPAAYVWWVLDCLGVGPDDEFDDLFRGSGAVTEAYERWRSQMALGLAS